MCLYLKARSRNFFEHIYVEEFAKTNPQLDFNPNLYPNLNQMQN